MSHGLFGLILFLLILCIFGLLVILSHILPSICGVFRKLLLYLSVCSICITASSLILVRSSSINDVLLIRHILVQFYIRSFLKSLVVWILLVIDWSSSLCTCVLLLLKLVLSGWFLLIMIILLLLSMEIYICVWCIYNLTFIQVWLRIIGDNVVWSHYYTVAHI